MGHRQGAAVTVAEVRSVVQEFSPSMQVCNSMHQPCLETGFGSQRRRRDVLGWQAGWAGQCQPAWTSFSSWTSLAPSNDNNNNNSLLCDVRTQS